MARSKQTAQKTKGKALPQQQMQDQLGLFGETENQDYDDEDIVANDDYDSDEEELNNLFDFEQNAPFENDRLVLYWNEIVFNDLFMLSLAKQVRVQKSNFKARII